MKRIVKLLAFAFLTFILSSTTVFAKEMTVNDLGEEVKTLKNKNVNYIYVIGEFAFTPDHSLTQEDIMLASRSINMTTEFNGENEATALQAMNIQKIVPTIDDNWEITGWESADNLVGSTTLPNNFNIRYIDYTFIPEKSKASFSVDVDKTEYSTYKNTLNTKLNFETEKFYGKNEEEKHAITIDENNKISGLLLKNKNVSLNETDQAKNGDYFFAYILEVPEANTNTTVKITNLNGETSTDWNSFDVKDEGKTPGIVLLTPINLEKFNKENGKIMTIVVDIDGESGKEYAPTTYTLDLSGLTFQGETSANFVSDYAQVNQSDKETLTSWGYIDTVNKNVTLVNGKLSGTLVEQQLINNAAFGKDNKDGYYFTFTIKPEGMTPETKNTVVVKQLKSESLTDIAKTYKRSEFDSDGNLTILYQFPSNSTTCTNDCKIYFSVDLDGEGDKYLPKIYTIDYSNNLIFEKASNFTVEGISLEDNVDFGHGWEEKAGYKTIVTQDSNDPHKYTVSGLLPIFDDTDWEDNDPFTEAQQDYYLGLLLKLTNLTEDMKSNPSSTIEVKFIHDGEEDTSDSGIKFYGNEFSSKGELYILKYLDPKAQTKQFQITIDLDGQTDDDVDTFAPYTVTIDYTDLKFQTYSTGNVGNNFVASDTDLVDDEETKTYLNDLKYNYEADAEVSISDNTIGGTIKEQTLDSSAGFQDNNRGYFVPVKISRPADLPETYWTKWTLTLNTEDGSQKEYTPSTEEYNQGWVLVLFKITEDNTEVKYKIDFDGPTNYDYLPTEYTIKYDGLQFLASNEVTFVYIDKDGTKHNDKEIIYENEQLGHNLTTTQDTDLRQFVGWYDDSTNEKVEETRTFGEHEKVIVNAHWKLYADKFVEAVVDDLNSDDTTYSDKFTDFTLNKEEAENKITINLNKVNTPLSDLAKTSIPGAIAYILNKGEIQDITLQVDGADSVTFNKNYTNDAKEYNDSADRDNELLGEAGVNLKKEIIEGAKETFDNKLDGNEETAKLDQLEYDNTKFTIKIGNPVDTVELVDNDGQPLAEEKKTYTFEFDADFVAVKEGNTIGAKTIKEVLDNETKTYDTVYIDGNITEDIIDTNKTVTIEGLPSTNATIASDSKDYLFDIQSSGNVTFKNLTLSGAKKSEIKVENGASVIADTIVISDIAEYPIEVSGSFEGKNLTYNQEDYEHPFLKVPDEFEDTAKVRLSNGSSTIHYLKVTKHENPWCDKNQSVNIYQGTELSCPEKQNVSWSDEYEWINGKYYFLDSSHMKNWSFVGFRDESRTTIIKIYEIGQEIKLPEKFKEEYKPIGRTDSSKKYKFLGWKKEATPTLVEDFNTEVADKGSVWYFAQYTEDSGE